METDGQFFFEPAPGDTGAAPSADGPGAVDQETFDYTLTDNDTPSGKHHRDRLPLPLRQGVVRGPDRGRRQRTSTSPFNLLTGTT